MLNQLTIKNAKTDEIKAYLRLPMKAHLKSKK